MTNLTLDQYQAGAAETAFYPGAGTPQGLSYTVLGLTEEAGEVAGHLKRVSRDDGGQLTPERREAMRKELGDVLWYLSRCAFELGFTLSEVGQANLDKLRSRAERGKIGGSGDDR